MTSSMWNSYKGITCELSLHPFQRCHLCCLQASLCPASAFAAPAQQFLDMSSLETNAEGSQRRCEISSSGHLLRQVIVSSGTPDP